ncbi:MAG: hypothetical protein Q8S20_08265 [Sulfuritalea sp.]|nr:hypothetical protein [Sulfuritalea sp.]
MPTVRRALIFGISGQDGALLAARRATTGMPQTVSRMLKGELV